MEIAGEVVDTPHALLNDSYSSVTIPGWYTQ
jgi:hypothetical protein